MGTPTFLERLEDWLERAVRGRRRESQAGGARKAHDTAAAEKRLSAGLRRQTTVSLRWVSERLRMGHYSRASRKPAKKLRRLMQQLEKS